MKEFLLVAAIFIFPVIYALRYGVDAIRRMRKVINPFDVKFRREGTIYIVLIWSLFCGLWLLPLFLFKMPFWVSCIAFGICFWIRYFFKEWSYLIGIFYASYSLHGGKLHNWENDEFTLRLYWETDNNANRS